MMTFRTHLVAGLAVLLLAVVAALQTDLVSATADYLLTKLHGGYTVGERIQMYGEAVAKRLQPGFQAAALAYPPGELALLAFKDTARLEVYARASPSEHWRRVREYPILGMSGGPGPKLREGDRQVPEGVYRVEFLNANSRFHLAIRLDYPNAFDLARAKADGRTRLGSDIMIHDRSDGFQAPADPVLEWRSRLGDAPLQTLEDRARSISHRKVMRAACLNANGKPTI